MDGNRQSETLVELGHQTALSGSIWTPFLQQARRELRASSIGLCHHQWDVERGVIEAAAGIPPNFTARYTQMKACQNLWCRQAALLPAGAAVPGSELVPVRELVLTDFYRAWLRPQNLLHALIGVIARDRNKLTCLLVMRHRQGEQFSTDDVNLLKQILPGLRRSREAAEHIKIAQRRAGVVRAVLDAVPEAIMVVDRNGEIRECNLAAKALLGLADGLRWTHDRVVATDAGENRDLRELIARNAGGGGSGECMLVTRAGAGDAPLLLVVRPLPGPEKGEEGLAVLSTRSKLGGIGVSANQLRSLFGLTRAEAGLTGLILGGASLKEAAGALHISKNTARTHMKHIYAKSDLHRQQDLRRLLEPSTLDPPSNRLTGLGGLTPRGDAASRSAS
ncbi:helix-turn-helix transcriptional regulator [Aquabacter sp. CN5-332]|uniref:helix-turn-helix transcriptional regulator n=1 Tax=Aquabacter sp. CN5-332 TaxID=3156608 RepID=UPI0032B4AD41